MTTADNTPSGGAGRSASARGAHERGALETAALAGGPTEFGAYLRSVDHQMRGVVWTVLRDPDATDDALQNAYEKAFRNLAAFDRRSSLTTWLHSICFRSAVDLARYEGRRRHAGIESADRVAVHGEFDEDCVRRLETSAALAVLEPDLRGLLYLTTALGFSFDEVAVISGLPRGTVASRVSRAKHRLNKESQ